MNRTLQWGLLIGLSAAVSALLLWLTIPAALLLGPIVAGILVTTHGGGRVAVPNQPFVLAQGLIGCMVAKMLPLSVASEVAGRWPVFVAGALSVIAASALLGLVLSRMKILPGSTALWGLSPGGATTMVLMAEAHGADAQLVAFMQIPSGRDCCGGWHRSWRAAPGCMWRTRRLFRRLCGFRRSRGYR